MRIILFTGKGGVGKTSVAAASALRSAALGYHTLVLSTDAAHSLADCFGKPLGTEPKLLAPNLWGQETDIFSVIEAAWGTLRGWLAALMAWRGIEEIMANELAVLPGMEELANLLYIMHYYERQTYDVIIVDCAPTGETLRLLSFPDMLRWWMDKLFPLERKAAGVLRPFVKPVLGNFPYPEDEVFDAAQHLFNELIRMRDLLSDPKTSSVRLVVNAERMVIREAQRTFTYLNLYGYPTDLVICNRLIPKHVEHSYFTSWKRSQGRHYRTIEESFSPLPVRAVPLFCQEVRGISMLRAMAEALYGDEDPTQVYYQGLVQAVHKADGHYVLTLKLPFTTKENVSLSRNGDELLIQAGRYRRNLLLPHSLLHLPIDSAKLEEGRLKITFVKDAKSAKKEHPRR